MDSEPVDHVVAEHSWREAGEGPPVVFLHGLGGTRSAWGPQLRSLSSSFRCIAWDMPGYGDAAPLATMTYEAIAHRLVALLDTVGVGSADLVGLSFGGMHAIHTALRHPDRIGRMVLADTSPAFGMDGTSAEAWQAARLEPLDRGETPADLAPHVIDSITTLPLAVDVRAELIEAFGQIPTAGFRAAVACLPTNDVRELLCEISHRCLVVVGSEDKETPVEYARALADGLRNAELHIIAGAGHLTPSETPLHFNQLVADFLRRDLS